MTLGIFDSGEGGNNLLRFARERNRADDIIFLCDRGRAPYGTKRDYELSGIVNENINRLKEMGAERIVIACCTACTVFGTVEDKVGVYPILSRAAKRAEKISKSKIAVIATGRTVASHAFGSAIKGREVVEIEAQPLVGIIDGGESDGAYSPSTERILYELLKRAEGADTLVLGCTHFSSLKGLAARVGAELGITNIVDAARVGAELVPKREGEGGIDYVFKTKNNGTPIALRQGW